MLLRKFQGSLLPIFGHRASKIAHLLLPDIIFSAYRRHSKDVFLLSYPCSGRTWLRILIGRALQLHHGFESKYLYDLYKVAYRDSNLKLPRLILQHDGEPHLKSPLQIALNKNEFKGSRVIFLVRDPRDVIVSWFFENSKRGHLPGSSSIPYDGSIPDFVFNKKGGIESIITYYNIWAENSKVPDDFLMVRYEDMQLDVVRELKRCLEFMGIDYLGDDVLQEAQKFASFQNMRNLEEENKLEQGAFRPGIKSDGESFKTRKGIVGGYQRYLTDDVIQDMDHLIKTKLSKKFGY